jgi:hypothetical protein
MNPSIGRTLENEMSKSGRTISVMIVAVLSVAAAYIAFGQASNLGVAEYGDGALAFPENTDRWILLGSAIGGNYSDEPFTAEDLRSIGVVQMEPTAYDYFLEHREYADGTMMLLTFYGADEKPVPALQGFTQGPVLQREIHVIDRGRFAEEGRAFFVFPGDATAPSPAIPPGSECVSCHTEHGDFDATFVQFYPALRGHLAE